MTKILELVNHGFLFFSHLFVCVAHFSSEYGQYVTAMLFFSCIFLGVLAKLIRGELKLNK